MNDKEAIRIDQAEVAERLKSKRIKGKNRMTVAAKLIGRHNEVLEIGCRCGEVTRLYASKNYVTGIDFIPEFIEEVKELKGDYFVWDADKGLGCFEDKSFDVVFIGETLEYLHNRNRCLKEIRRVLRKDGRLIICEVNKFSLRRRLKFLFGEEIHDLKYYIHFFHHKELRRLITRNGFRITKWINFGTHVKNIKLPIATKDLCDTWVIEARR